MKRPSWLCFVLSLSAAVVARGSDSASTRPSGLVGVGIDQRLGTQLPLDAMFRDESDKAVRLGDYFGQKPVILNFVYHNCPMLCPTVVDGLIKSLNSLSFDVGKEFEVLTISFDPADTSKIGAAKKKEYLSRYGRQGADKGWHFLTGDRAAIERVTSAAGFHYHYDPETKQFAHAAGIVVATPKGNLARYFYGITYDVRDLRLSLVEASDNRIGSAVDQILLFCCRYDPTTGKYGLIIANVMKLAGLATVLCLGSFLGLMLRREQTANHGTRNAKSLCSGQGGVL